MLNTRYNYIFFPCSFKLYLAFQIHSYKYLINITESRLYITKCYNINKPLKLICLRVSFKHLSFAYIINKYNHTDISDFY